MQSNQQRNGRDVLLAILAIIAVIIALIILIWVLVALCSLLWAGLSYGYVTFIEMNQLWSTNVWTSIYYLGQIVTGLGLIVILIPILNWIGRHLFTWGKKSYQFIYRRLGGVRHD